MADHVQPSERSRIMAAVASKNTKPEMAVRSIVHKLGYRYRLHSADLPGTPDLVFPSRGKVIFVHGCFWHRHHRCRYASQPKTHVTFWIDKFHANLARDRRVQAELKKLGWEILIVWQCELKNQEKLSRRLDDFLAV